MGTQIPASVHIRLLGGFRVEVGPHTIDNAAWRLRKAKAIIKLLALSPGHRLHREQILNLLWPDLPPKAALNNLHQSLHIARRAFALALELRETTHVLSFHDEVLILDPSAPLWVDVHAFEAAATAALGTSDVSAHERAVSLYAGDLLPEDLYEEWTLDRREALYERYLSLLLRLARLYEDAGEWAPATEALKQVLAREPAHEEAHVGLMRLYALQGHRHTAMQQYERLKEALREHLDADPDQTSTQLLQEILADRFPPPETQVVTSAAPAASVARSRPQRPPVRHMRPRPRPGNLPTPLTTFVGRAGELAGLKDVLAESRLLTLTGPGGCGKTRLALELAAAVSERFSDGTWWVDLQALQDSNLIVNVIASTLGIGEQPRRPMQTLLAEHLVDRRTLLVLDNCEHLLAGCTVLAETLLQVCPGVRIVATSRERLGVAGETRWPVPPLSLPLAHPELTVEEALASEAVRLFESRSRFVNPAFRLTGANVRAVAEICRALDGLPLSIELAAARTAHLSADQILERLGDRFHFLTLPGSAPTRYRTLGEAIDWSYGLLSMNEQTLFNRLSVFAGTFSLEAVQAVCTGEDLNAKNVLAIISGLIDRSMVLLAETPKGDIRYRQLITIREYARERLAESGEEGSLRERHLAWCLALAREGDASLRGSSQLRWLQEMESTHDDFRAALECSLASGNREAALRLAGNLHWFWLLHEHWSEGRAWLEKALRDRESVSPTVLPKALRGATVLARRQGDHTRQASLAKEGLELSRILEDREGLVWFLMILSNALLHQGDLQQAAPLAAEALEIARDLKEIWLIGTALSHVASIVKAQSDYESAITLYSEGLDRIRETRDEFTIAYFLRHLGIATLRTGKPVDSARFFAECLILCRKLNEKWLTAECLDGLAEIASSRGEYDEAAHLFAAAQTLADELGILQIPEDTVANTRWKALVREKLGNESFAAMWAEGRSMSVDQAVEYALQTARSVLTDQERPAVAEAPPGAAGGPQH